MKISTSFSNEMQLDAASVFNIMVFVLFELASARASLKELLSTSKAISYTLISLEM